MLILRGGIFIHHGTIARNKMSFTSALSLLHMCCTAPAHVLLHQVVLNVNLGFGFRFDTIGVSPLDCLILWKIIQLLGRLALERENRVEASESCHRGFATMRTFLWAPCSSLSSVHICSCAASVFEFKPYFLRIGGGRWAGQREIEVGEHELACGNGNETMSRNRGMTWRARREPELLGIRKETKLEYLLSKSHITSHWDLKRQGRVKNLK